MNSDTLITTPLIADVMPTDETNCERFEREIECSTNDGKPVRLRAWADLNGLDRMEVETIEELSVEDIRQLANYGEGGIVGESEAFAQAAPAHRLAELGGAAQSMQGVPRRRPTNSGI